VLSLDSARLYVDRVVDQDGPMLTSLSYQFFRNAHSYGLSALIVPHSRTSLHREIHNITAPVTRPSGPKKFLLH
jgi:hypothetical protein